MAETLIELLILNRDYRGKRLKTKGEPKDVNVFTWEENDENPRIRH